MIRSLSIFVLLPCVLAAAHSASLGIPKPSEAELERLVGNRTEPAIKNVRWRTDEPQQTNLIIYSVGLTRFDESLVERVAKYFGIPGKLEPFPKDHPHSPGYWIRQVNATNAAKSRSVSASLFNGTFSYSAGDDGYRYDLQARRPDVRGVPDKEQAKAMALNLLPLLGLSENDLEHQANGRLRWSSGSSDIGYTDRADMQRKKVAMAQQVTFYQRVPGGGTTSSVGDGGQLRFVFVSEGKVSEIEWFFRPMTNAGTAKPKTSRQILRDIEKANAWTWHGTLPSSITITNCVLAYPQGNSGLGQQYVWPFYRVMGASSGRTVTLFVPLEW
jgi:hypothetical protein